MATYEQVSTDAGYTFQRITGLMMQNGSTILDNAKCILLTVTTDASGNFTQDISGLGFTVAPFALGEVYITTPGLLTTALLSTNIYDVNFKPPTTTSISGVVTKPNTVVLGGLSISLLSSPVTVNLILFGQ